MSWIWKRKTEEYQGIIRLEFTSLSYFKVLIHKYNSSEDKMKINNGTDGRRERKLLKVQQQWKKWKHH